MYSDPFYRQLIKVMQETGKESAPTRQSARYRDDLQSAKNSSSNVVKQKPKKRYKVEIPSNYSVAKMETMNRLIRSWKIQRLDRQALARDSRIEFLKTRIQSLKEAEQLRDSDMKSEDVLDSS